jgi:hypothetical protein
MNKDQEERIQVNHGGLKCDNPACDWVDPTIQVEDYKDWLNAPCPKCGENVLTEEDFNNTMFLRSIVGLVNAIPEEKFEEFTKKLSEIRSENSEEDLKKKYNLPEDTKRISMTLDVHKGIHIKDVKADDSKE